MSKTTARVTYEHAEPLFVHLSLTDPRSPEHEALRDRIIEVCLPLAEHIARKYANRGEIFDDLLQTARLGMVMAVDRYDVTTGSPFLGFAVPTIMGEVRRHFRDHIWPLHVPRREKELQGKVRAATEEMSRRLQRAPTAHELAIELEVPVTDIARTLVAANAFQTRSLDTPARENDGDPSMTVADTFGADDPHYRLAEDTITVAPLLAQLSPEDRQLLIWRFYDTLSQGEIAERLGVSQMSVSRKLTRLLGNLRAEAADEQPVPA
ncbi:SigB/SigF/SigG family RNA polymerase sigma factor [Nocardia sp. PE-7]|uniref:SigB/SigF/SigG family RNA polymerase sigma factor n=1 Tax=Nocardia sp. PE-7 TaxID=3058426 RepID=UPI0026585CDD|nr:SigB/SigF/SigG family RNA polymerase sigma factor [Nocardia sp. PE-7]WKG12731.1 SigB/SigF/SigG family RNA polymerase sigma factor [Nocardia sp. PE-7]